MSIEILPLEGIGEVQPGDEPAWLIAAALDAANVQLLDGDVVVVAQKIISKAENAIRRVSDVVASEHAHDIAKRMATDPRRIQIVLDESRRIIHDDRVLIVETHHGFICANAGVDNSNVPDDDVVTLLPRDSDASAHRLREGLAARATVAVIISDSFGRPWRTGITNVCLGLAGMAALDDLRGTHDDNGVELHATVIATADEIACAAELVMGKTNRVPVAIVRGLTLAGDGSGKDLLRPAEEDLFRRSAT